jgi:hypothetical protein
MTHQRVQITAGATSGPDNKVIIDGVDITNRLAGFSFTTGGRNDAPTLTLEYMCVEGIEIEGVAFVRHQCPLAEEDKSAA